LPCCRCTANEHSSGEGKEVCPEKCFSIIRIASFAQLSYLGLAASPVVVRFPPLADIYPLTHGDSLMALRLHHPDARPPRREDSVNIHLLGVVDYEDCLSLQRRLAYDAVSRGDGRIVVLICEHPPLITIGRGGSRGQVKFTAAELAQRELAIRYVSRGGGAILHAPGQLAIYPIMSLADRGWTVSEYTERLESALAGALREFKVTPVAIPESHALVGRSGVLAVVGASVRQGITLHGAFLNVNPEMRDFGRVEVAGGQTMSSLLSHRALPTKMTKVRAALVTHLADALLLERYHLHTGHPLLAELPAKSHSREAAA
jgi:lipoyl(octanoyl) transferase